MRPIVIYSYNRPEYLQHTLNSLVGQITTAVPVHFFQDGPRNHTERGPINTSIELCRQIIPHAAIHAADRNLGVAFNQKRGRDFIFGEYDSAVFLEDDVVLNDYYLDMLNNLMDKLDDGKTSLVSCFGESHRKPDVFNFLPYLKQVPDKDEEQMLNRDKLMHMEHIWAYGMFRNAYRDVMQHMQHYYDMLPQEYRMRPHQRIYDWLATLGVNTKNVVSSQDSVMSSLLVKLGYNSYSTFTANMRYIGEWGEHSRPHLYEQSWKNHTVFTEPEYNFVINDEVKNSIRKYLESVYT